MNEQTAHQIETALLTFTQLKERGWTNSLIARFLDAPDSTKPNPHYRSGPPMRLYAIARVETCEASAEWQEAAAKASKRSEIGKAVAARKAAELLAQVEVLPITVDLLPPERLVARAVASYNAYHDRQWERGYDYEPATMQSDPAFLERITVNFIRHELTYYDTHLEDVAGQIGVSDAIDGIRRRVYNEIAAVYPGYAQECIRQQRYRAQMQALNESRGA